MRKNDELIGNVSAIGSNMEGIVRIGDCVCFVPYALLGEKINVYARPVAFVALMICVLINRREAIFLNVISALLLLVIDTFAGTTMTSTNEYYSSLIISFSAGMLCLLSARSQ